MIPLFRVSMAPEAGAAANAVLESGYIGQGPKVDQFERALEPWTGATPVTVSSGTAALSLALRLARVRGRKVVTTPMTCSATNIAILNEGGIPVWADIDPITGLIDPDSVADRINGVPPAAIMAVDWGGQPCDYDELMGFGVPVIEDAAHSFGATYQGRMVGTLASYTAFSFQAIKHLTTGDGGALVPPLEQHHRARNLRWFGIDRDFNGPAFRGEQDIPEVGDKWHMNDIAAAIGLANLIGVGEILGYHRAIAEVYDERLDERFVRTAPAYKHTGSWWMYTVLLPDPITREAFRAHMLGHEIMVSQVHWRSDKLSAFAPYARPDLPGVDEFAGRMICLPCHPMTPVETVIEIANGFFGG